MNSGVSKMNQSNFNGTGLYQGDSLEKFKENNLAKANYLKLQTQENLLKCFHEFTKALTKISKNMEIHSMVETGNSIDFSTIEITSEKVRGDNVDFSTSKSTSKKVRENNVNFRPVKLHRKQYLETTWIF